MRWDAAQELGMQDLLRSVFDARLMQRLQGAGLADDRLVFITGMPRSGTTLLDRMLTDRKSTRLNSSHVKRSRMPSSA